jgi:hypothetical protein
MALADYITNNFGQVKTQLGWGDSTTLVTIVAKALELYPAASEGAATDSTKLHALADVAVWRQALNDVSLDYDFSADQSSFKRSQQADLIRQNLAMAENAAIVYMPSYMMSVHPEDANPDWYA